MSTGNDAFSEYDRVMVFAAHADDEMAMAGTMTKFVRSGTDVTVAVMTDGCEGYPDESMRDKVVAMRRREAAECDKVLGIKQRFLMGQPDMGLEASKAFLQACIKIVREVRPDAVFTHGPSDRHGDHRMTHHVSVDAVFHAGQPVSAALGAPWKTGCLYYYKGVRSGLPTVTIDVTDTIYKRWEALATQESQFTLFKMNREQMLAKADEVRKHPERTRETFWIADSNGFDRFLTL